MLDYILAITLFIGSFAYYIAPFFYPELHRKGDFFLSGLGLFYGLVLWICAGSITGGVLLGQVVGVTLLGWFALETGYLRRSLTLPEEQTEITSQLQEKIDSALQTGWVADLLAPITGVGRSRKVSRVTYSTINNRTS